METQELFEKIMQEQPLMTVATSVNDQPNVRIVSFIYDKQKKCVLFTTFKGSEKSVELSKNNRVAFTTIPLANMSHVRVHYGLVEKSQLSVQEIAQQFIDKIPGYEKNIEMAGDRLVVYEIHFSEALVNIGAGHSERIIL